MSPQEMAEALYHGDLTGMDYFDADESGSERWVYIFEDGSRADVHIVPIDEDGWPIVASVGEETG